MRAVVVVLVSPVVFVGYVWAAIALAFETGVAKFYGSIVGAEEDDE